ncbi:response regulator [Rhizorhabdus dicambivorans]|uniref:DNA-binding response regulator n=1 Tax=Rhizorhabdus dicambivorans TaxID=1850238 RepID=A0A2A4FTR3_9SPHN|nr:response regulator transcription factor [Rhizorhabdus dicambivorans]ATE65797.1 DNA-binding response regulator [Rhizorhabdus dicambivorans]PCE41120.1 DNA-binding response regulator [Rhizorhabdus dicambivorans]
MSRAKVLIVDDEPHIRRLLRTTLERTDYEVVEAGSAREGLERLGSAHPDIVLLDLGLPDRDGLELVPIIRQRSKATLLVVSAREATDQKVAALDLGADDYVTKPFDTEELLARMRAAFRNRKSADGAQLRVVIGSLEIDLLNRVIRRDGEELHLTPKEFGVLAELARFPGRVITHDQILKSVWPNEYERHVEYLRVVIRNLRQKVEADLSRPRIIVNELGVGYRLLGADG